MRFFIYIIKEKIFSGPFGNVHFSDFFKILSRYLPRILKKITKVNVAKWSRKIFFLSNIWKNATFIENNFFSKMARLWTFFPNRKWFQLFVYYFSKKKKFSLKDYPNSFYVFLNVPRSFLPFLKIFISKLETSFFAMFRYPQNPPGSGTRQFFDSKWSYLFSFMI